MIGNQLKEYTIISLLGEGGMAYVYLAEHATLRNQVAIKLLKEDYVHHPNIRKRFLAEARNLAKMSHPNIIRVSDLIDAGDIVAFVMEYSKGETLDMFLAKSIPLTDVQITDFFNQMVLALEYVHDQGMIHRDIKPSNFIVTSSGQMKLLDFGIAKNTNEGAEDYTKTGLAQQMGTPLYMSPEQVRSTAEVTKETDIYSLGVVLWQMVTAKKPYDTKDLSMPEIQVLILKENLPPTHTPWDQVIQKAMDKDPAKRRLVQFDKNWGKTVQTESESHRRIPTERNKELRSRYIFASTVLFLLFLLAVFIFIFSNKEEPKNFVTSTPDDSVPEVVVPSDSEQGEVSMDTDPENDQTTSEKNEDQSVEGVKIQDQQNQTDKLENQIVEAKNTEVTGVSPGILKVGQYYQGGVIVYLDNTNKHGLIMEQKNLGFLNWWEAKKVCTDHYLNGYGNWDLPTKSELNMIYEQRSLYGRFPEGPYWTSDESEWGSAWVQYFTRGGQYYNSKKSEGFVRPVRNF